MARTFALFIVLIVWTSVHSQAPVTGTYRIVDKPLRSPIHVIDFKDSGFFSYTGVIGFTTLIGEGNYYLTPTDSLILEFSSCPDCKPAHKLDYGYASSDSVTIELSFLERDSNKPLKNVQVRMERSGIKQVTDDLGIVKAKYPRLKAEEIIQIQAPLAMYEEVIIPVGDSVTSVKGIIRFGNYFIYKNIRWAFKLANWKQGELVLFGIRGRYEYERMPDREVRILRKSLIDRFNFTF